MSLPEEATLLLVLWFGSVLSNSMRFAMLEENEQACAAFQVERPLSIVF
jgi:hypothetical protein